MKLFPSLVVPDPSLVVSDPATDSVGSGPGPRTGPRFRPGHRAPSTQHQTARIWQALSIQVLTEPPTAAGQVVASSVVDNRTDIRDFLASRRARITPEQSGLPAYGGHRRVPGLRREEVAMLAAVSVDYYTRLERGNLKGVSEGVLDALAPT